MIFGSAAQANTVTVTTLDGSQGWSSPPSENTGGGSATITATPIDGNGSMAVTGDRSRVAYGGLIGLFGNPTVFGNNLGTVSQFADLSFSYEIDPTSVSALDPKYSPALRLVFWNGVVKDELVYEAAYQPGGYSSEGAIGSLNVTDSNSFFYLKSENNVNHAMSISSWLGANPSLSNDIVGGFYVGVGSSAGSSYLAHVDDVIANGTKYNFEVAGVPEPASWAMMIMGFGVAGTMLRSNKRRLANSSTRVAAA
ncbi:MAG: hypothetical protein JWO84_502 [Parcubacteria group bacterium]|nr:hypothetical protein [Parcubacteria group bacterium]